MTTTPPGFSIRGRLAWVMALLIGLICLVIFLYIPGQLRRQAVNGILDEAHNVTDMAAYSVGPGLAANERSAVAESLYSLRENRQLAYVMVLDQSQEVFASFSGRLADRYRFDQVDMSLRPEPFRKGKPNIILGGFSKDGQIYQTSSPVLFRGRQVGRIDIGFSLAGLNTEIAASRRTIALVSLIIFLIGVLTAILLSMAITGPLGAIVKTAESIAGGDMSRRAEVIQRDEVGKLAISFNTMVDRLEATQNQLENVNQNLERRVDERTAELTASEERYRMLFERNLAGVYIRSLEGKLLSCNDAFARMFGFQSSAHFHESAGSVSYLEPGDEQKLRDLLAKQGSVTNFEVQLAANNGQVIWGLENVRLTPTDPPRLEGVLLDITDRKKSELEIEYQAYHDGLTGLTNRALFRDRLAAALNRVKRNQVHLAVLFLDLDNLKAVNDTLGHVTGDSLLQNVAWRLTESLRQDDTVARVGGDEFTILLPELKSDEDATPVARKIVEAFRLPFYFNEDEVYVTASVGIALYPSDGEDPDTLVTNADRAMYRVKESGGDDYHFFRGGASTTPALGRMTLEQNLRQAVEREEFAVYYQPQINTQSGEITGVEALVRWNHPNGMVVEPSGFVSLAEHSGLIIPIGETVLFQACLQMQRWHQAGFPHLRVGVNVSARQFHQRNFVGMVQRVIQTTRINPASVELEVTESLAMQTSGRIIAKLHELKRLGVSIAMDDFGTGQSSLSYLKQFPIDTVKIDRSFVRNVAIDRSDESIVAAILLLCNSLRMRTVAEGVETAEQFEYLRRHGCVEIQGFYFSRPLPAVKLAELLETKSPVGMPS